MIRAYSLRDMLEFARALPAAADAEGRERGDHHRRRWFGRTALGCLRGQRADADGDADRTSTRPSASSSRRSGRRATRWTSPAANRRRTYRNTIALALEDDAHPLPRPGLLAHDHHTADGVRQARGEVVEEMRARESTSRWWPRWPATSRSRRPPASPLSPQHPGLRVHHRDPGQVLGGEVPLGEGGGVGVAARSEPESSFTSRGARRARTQSVPLDCWYATLPSFRTRKRSSIRTYGSFSG